VHALIAGRVVAECSCHFVVLRAQRSCYLDLRSETVAIGFDADQLQDDPVVPAVGAVHPHFRPAVQYRDYDIDLAVVVEVSEGCAAMWSWN
jgi:hypothetical protein